jgi:hypothetical protein
MREKQPCLRFRWMMLGYFVGVILGESPQQLARILRAA